MYKRPKTPSTIKKPGPPTKPKPLKEQVNDKDPVEVYCRLRPSNDLTDLLCVRRFTEKILELNPPSASKSKSYYSFKYVFPQNTTQSELFESVALPLVEDVLHGKNGLLFTYGITSSGKTFTLTGSPSNCGVLPRCVDVLFNSIQKNQARKFVFKPDGQNGFEIRSTPDALLEWQKDKSAPKTPSTPFYSASKTPKRRKQEEESKDWDQREKDKTTLLLNNNNAYSVFVSYVEIYKNYIYDLLDENSVDQFKLKQPQSKTLREDVRKRVFVNGGTEVEVTSAEEAFEMFQKGIKRRKIAHTSLNTESSRSHSVFNIRVLQAPVDNGEVVQDDRYMTISQLSLVDLAGSERTARTQNTGERLKEAGNINNSLMALRNCIEILRENQNNKNIKMVPYRDNKLTHLFKSFFEGEGKIRMIICVNPRSDDYDETLHVMKFAETTQEVMVAKASNLPLQYPHRFDSRETFPKSLQGIIDLTSLGAFGPPLPTVYLRNADDEKIIPEWLECLNERKVNKKRKLNSMLESQSLFRQQLYDIEKENMLMKAKVSHLTIDLEARENQMRDLEARCGQMERMKSTFEKTIYDGEKKLKLAEYNLNEREKLITQTEVEKERMKIKMRERLDSEVERIKRIFERILAEKQAQLEKEQCLTKEKMHLVKEILDTNNTNWDVLQEFREGLATNFNMGTLFGVTGTRTGGNVAPTAPSIPSASSAATQEMYQTQVLKRRSEFDIRGTPSQTGTPIRHQSIAAGGEITSPLVENNLPPVANPRHRRSLSSGNEKWIDHRPPGTLDLGTVLQPKIKNKKSLSNLKNVDADVLKEASKYALTHHIADNFGEVETRVYKGEVIPSMAGGAQVIFDDIETLKQSAPGTLSSKQSYD